jgi:threonine dehydrogenase-like Zn-dependent dehydrogenase
VDDFSYWISEPLACAVNGIRGSEIEVGDNVCLIGCGYMGLLLIQAMPKSVINNFVAIDIRDERLKLAKKFGVESILNPKKVNIVKEVHDIFDGEADVVIEASGAPRTLDLATELVRGGKPKKQIRGGKIVIFGRHVIDEKVPTEKWHMKGLEVLNISPMSSINFNRDFHDAVKLLKKGIFDQKSLITHKFNYKDAKTVFKIASKKTENYIKGTITF